MRFAVIALLACACAQSNAVTCQDGRTCPASTRCDDSHALCVSLAQTAACAALADGDACSADEVAGICDHGVCVEGCSDGAVGYDWARLRDEECDDGNRRSHDGCSSQCTTERPTWLEWQTPWQGRQSIGAVYDPVRNVIVAFGGLGQSGATDAQWERDSADIWHDLELSPRPSARYSVQLAFDAVRHVVVLFGGRTSSQSALGDTWEYDGTSWALRATAASPPARSDGMMFFDTTRATVVLHGGATASGFANDTWEYDGTSWTEIPATNPTVGRAHAAIVWDADRQRAVMFGGIGILPGPISAVFDETWEWTGSTATWTKLTTTGKPEGRFGAAMVYNSYSVNRKVYLFGGTHSGPYELGDVWSFDGTTQTWSQIALQNAPPSRTAHAAVFDPGSAANEARMVIIGGTAVSGASAGEAFADVWEYAFGARWLEASPEFPPRQEARLVEDEPRGELVDLHTLQGTWVFDATQRWHNVAPAGQVAERRFASVVYDRSRQRVVAFGGELARSACPQYAETLVWDGAQRQWTVELASGPPGRSMAPLAYDVGRDVIVLAGGLTNVCGTGQLVADTWELANGTWTNTVLASPTIIALGYDQARERMIGVDDTGVTRSYADGAWTDLGVPPVPFTIYGALAYNPDRERLTYYGGGASEARSDVWELEDAGWVEVEVIGAFPPSRSFTSLASHRPSRSLVTLGGGARGTVVGDTWQLSYRSDTPDEVCANGIDDDDDHEIDAADPDCP